MKTYRDIFLEKDEPVLLPMEEEIDREEEDALALADLDDEQ